METAEEEETRLAKEWADDGRKGRILVRRSEHSRVRPSDFYAKVLDMHVRACEAFLEPPAPSRYYLNSPALSYVLIRVTVRPRSLRRRNPIARLEPGGSFQNRVPSITGAIKQIYRVLVKVGRQVGALPDKKFNVANEKHGFLRKVCHNFMITMSGGVGIWQSHHFVQISP